MKSVTRFVKNQQKFVPSNQMPICCCDVELYYSSVTTVKSTEETRLTVVPAAGDFPISRGPAIRCRNGSVKPACILGLVHAGSAGASQSEMLECIDI
jgi:hypothetical protein